MENYAILYKKAVNLYNQGNYVEAIPYFNKTVTNIEFKTFSLLRLFDIYTKVGNYSESRNVVNMMTESKLNDTLRLLATLEHYEYNYNSSLELFMEAFNNSIKQIDIMLKLVDIYMFFGYLDVARSMSETLLLDKNSYLNASKKIITLDFLEGDYKHASKVIESIRDEIKKKEYENVVNIIEYFLRKKITKFDRDAYMPNLLNDKTDERLINHIRRHFSINSKRIMECFHEEVDIKKLLEIVRNKIKSFNPQYGVISSLYTFKMENIGNANAIQVSTIIGTDEIITMYPVSVSSEFNREGLLENQELLLRRGVR